jgi:hypothetical protein
MVLTQLKIIIFKRNHRLLLQNIPNDDKKRTAVIKDSQTIAKRYPMSLISRLQIMDAFSKSGSIFNKPLASVSHFKSSI